MAYLPELFQEFQQRLPECSQASAEVASKCHLWAPQDEKTRRLIKLGIAIGLDSEGGVRSHARRALEAGVSVDELRHTVLLALTTVGFPRMAAAMKWVDTVIEKRK